MGRLISSCSHVLTMIVHVQISVALFLNKCPEKLMWTIRAKQLCGVEDKYMCLYDTNERSFRELCKESPEFHRPGNVFVISGNLQYFAGRPCYSNKYQPHKWWTNGSSDCQYLKSSCNGEGQVPYDNGTITRNRKCRCDYTSYYTSVISTKNKCHCNPIEEDCSCYRKRCSEDQVLTPDYDCVGIHEWTGRFVCPEYKHPKIIDDKKLPQQTICPNIKKDSSGTIQQSSTRIAVSLLSGALVILSLIVIIRNASKEDIKDVNTTLNNMRTKFEALFKLKEELPEQLKIMKTENEKEEFIPRITQIEIEQKEAIPQNIRVQIQSIIEDWKKNDKMFVSTRASKYVMECLNNNNCVTLTAPSGVGKSFIARHTALLLKNKGYRIIPVYAPTDIRDYYQPGYQTVFIVDDICGNFTANQQHIDSWKKLLPVINTIIADTCCKIIVSCRLQVYKDDKFEILTPFKSCECNLISYKLCLTSEEKTTIAKTYIGTHMKDIDDFSKNSNFFPLLCSLYHEQNDVDFKDFFKNPFAVYKRELDMLSQSGYEGNLKICSLALCVLFNNQLTEKWFKGRMTEQQHQIIKDTCEACEMPTIPKTKLQKVLETLDGTFICKQNGIYSTVHKTLFDFLAHYFGQKMIECLIDHGDSDLVHERFILHTSTDEKTSNIDFIIEIPDDYLELYLERFIKDWSVGKVAVVFSNNNMKVSSFRQQLIQYLQQLDKLQQVVLANKVDTVSLKESCDAGTTPLVCYCHYGYTDMVQWMLRNDVVVDQCRDDGTTGLIMASQNGHIDIVKLLLERNTDVNLCDNDGLSPLLQASQEGHTDIVKLLLGRNPDVNLCDKNGWSPLILASYKGHTDIVKLLLERNPDVNLCDKDGYSPLIQASVCGHTDIVRLLLERNPAPCDNTSLSTSYVYNNISISNSPSLDQPLIKHKPDVNAQTYDGGNALYFSALDGNIEITQLLLENNADSSICIYSKQYIAEMMKNHPTGTLGKFKQHIFDTLVKSTASRVTEYVSQTSVDYAFNVVAGSSPLHIACFMGRLDVVCCLLDNNANINITKEDGTTPLFYSCEVGHEDIVRLLLDKKAETKICRLDGKSPLKIAIDNKHTAIVEIVTEHIHRTEPLL